MKHFPRFPFFSSPFINFGDTSRSFYRSPGRKSVLVQTWFQSGFELPEWNVRVYWLRNQRNRSGNSIYQTARNREGTAATLQVHELFFTADAWNRSTFSMGHESSGKKCRTERGKHPRLVDIHFSHGLHYSVYATRTEAKTRLWRCYPWWKP